ncbi:MAG: pyruvate-ferredoxin/flavodoxin oxidoreductase [Acidobacteriota bacterium]|nr:pyruvate-ferredoxin/flavodoxin oxidoreductase [Acidobacteriota bacterium]
MPDAGSSRPLVERLFGGGHRRAAEPGQPFVGTGIAALAEVARAAGAHLVVEDALAGEPALAGALDGGFATALGLALGGERVALLVGEAELAASAALAREAVERRVPLCIVLASSTLVGARRAAEAGMAVLVPGTVAEAVDHACAAILAAESALVPVVVALDGPTLAFAVQAAGLPSVALLGRLLGRPADSVHSEGVAERELFGEHRRRIPRWHDATRAIRLGGELGPQAGRAACAAERIFFTRDLTRHLDSALARVGESTGRPLPAVAGAKLRKADLGLVATGAFAETARALAATLGRSAPRLGVLALRRLAPLPESELVELVGGCRKLAVIERIEHAAGAGVLTATLRGALSGAGVELATLGVAGEGASHAAGDLAGGCRALAERFRPLLLTGLGKAASDAYPKRRALHDQFRRELPGWDELAAPGEPAIDLRPAGAVTVRFERLLGNGSLARDAARLLGAALGGHLHSRMDRQGAAAGLSQHDWLVWAPEPFADPGEPPAGDLDFRFVRPPEGGERDLFLGALAALVARRAGRELKERALRAAGEQLRSGLAAEEVEARCADLLAGFAEPEVAAQPFLAGASARQPAAMPPHLPVASADGGALGDAARFWDQIGLPIGEGAVEELLPDPTLALAAVPARCSPVGASHLGEGLRGRPAFLPEECTGCAACWTLCPHSAIEVNAQPIVALLEAGITAVGRTGRSAELLRRFLRKLAERVAFEAATRHGGALGEWLASAGGAVFAAAGLAPERLDEARAALALVASELGSLQVAATPNLFFSEAGTTLSDGALLVLAVDPDRCTGCGICVAECAPGALVVPPVPPVAPAELAVSAAEDVPARLAAQRATIRAFGQLPPSDAAAVERVAVEPKLGALAAALLTREGVAPLAGFDRALPGSPSRLAVRQAFGLLARALAPQRAARRADLQQLGERLAAAVHTSLGKALPDRDLAALSRGLESAGGGAADLGELASRLAGAVAGERVDVARLGHLVDAARAVADLGARLGTDDDPSPLFSVVVGPGEALAWARQFPDNPFAVPATVAIAAPLALARGLAMAEAERAVAAARVLRRARLELERPQEALLAPELLASLAWGDLDAAERSLAVPLIVLIDESAGDSEAGEVNALLAAALPVAVVTLDSACGRGPRSAWWAIAAAAALAEEGIVAHAAIAGSAGSADLAGVASGTAPLAEAWAAFAVGGRGALVRLLAPGSAFSAASGFPADLADDYVLDRARRAVEAREFPLGCRIAAAPSTPTALRVDPFAAREARATEHEAELAALAERHRTELSGLEVELRHRLAERARTRLLELAARRDAGGESSPVVS